MDSGQSISDELAASYFQDLLCFPFIQVAFNNTVYDKFFRDGYIYYKCGLFPVNKEIFNNISPDSPVYFLYKENNSDNYKLLWQRVAKAEIPNDFIPSMLESRLLLYALFQAKYQSESVLLAEMFLHFYPNSSYIQYGNFIIQKSIQPLEITSLQTFTKYLSGLQNSKNLFYRGQSNVNYIVIPSLFREKRLYSNEYMMYQELVIRCPSAFSNCTSHLDFLMQMQHYGLPTRLLDISSNPLVSLYFACLNTKTAGELICYNIKNEDIKYEKCDDVSVLTALPMLTYHKQMALLSNSANNTSIAKEFLAEVNMERPNILSIEQCKDLCKPIVVKPARKNSRISHQEGAFIIWGLDKTYYGEKNVHISPESHFRYVENGKKTVFYIQPKNKAKILTELNRVGINQAFVYPEIDDVAAYIKETIS